MNPRMTHLIAAILCVFATVAAHADDLSPARAVFADLRVSLDRIETQLPALADAADAAAQMIVDGAGLIVADEPLASELTQGPGAMLVERRSRNVTLSLTGDRMIVEAGTQRFTLDTAGLPVAAAWAFQCELFSACVRRGEVPVVRQSFEIDTRRRRYRRYEGQRFHHDRWLPRKLPREKLGRRYLAGLRGILLDLETAGGDAIAQTIHSVNAARASGGGVYVVAGGPYLPHRLPQAPHGDAGIRFLGDTLAGSNDFIIAIGVDAPVGGEWWGDADRLRAAGRGVAWIVNACNTGPRDLTPGDLLIDLWTPVGDGMVKVEHYDARLGPANTFAADAILRAIVASLDPG